MRESKIEREVTKYAKEKGWEVFKWSSPGQRGVMDKIFMKTFRKIFFIEFKATGKEGRKLQKYIAAILVSMGFAVYFVDDIEQGKRIVDKHDEM